MLEDIARRFGLAALLVALFLVVLFSENGLVDYIYLKKQISAMDTSVARLQKENVVLKGQIDRLRQDDRYLEEIAVRKYGFIKEGQKVYRIEK